MRVKDPHSGGICIESIMNPTVLQFSYDTNTISIFLFPSSSVVAEPGVRMREFARVLHRPFIICLHGSIFQVSGSRMHGS